MKKAIFITVGTLILILVVGVWAYLFAFGAPKSGGEIFARFGGGNDAEITTLPENTNIDVGDTDTTGAPQALKQLTTRPVAGAGFVTSGIRYVEQGTGHVYEINLLTGSETLLSGTTIPGARHAVFSPDSMFVAITMDDEGVSKTLAGKVGLGAQFSGVSLPDNATNVAFANASGTLEYTLVEGLGTVGYSYNILKETSVKVFELPLRDIEVLWGNPTYVYTTPSATQIGYIYQVIKNDLHYVTDGARGLMGFHTPTGLVITKNLDAGVHSYKITNASGTAAQVLPLIPEKCTSGETFFYCAVPKSKLDVRSFPDDWYMGTVWLDDVLWTIDATKNSATSLVDFTFESGRAIDVLKIGTDAMGKKVYLINKNDNTLWLFDTTRAGVPSPNTGREGGGM